MPEQSSHVRFRKRASATGLLALLAQCAKHQVLLVSGESSVFVLSSYDARLGIPDTPLQHRARARECYRVVKRETERLLPPIA